MRWTRVASLALVLAAGSAEAEAEDAEKAPETLEVVVTGDVGLNRSGLPVDPRGVRQGKGVHEWSEMSAGIAELVDGDLNFMNLETVVTDRNDLKGASKGQKRPFLFKSHPAGVRHLAELGFNLVSLGNNHSYDYLAEGVLETLRHVEPLEEEGLIHASGIGRNEDEASRPDTFDFRGAKVAFTALGTLTNMIRRHRAGPEKPGSMGYRLEKDWKLVTRRLAEAEADLKILSIHYGREGNVRVDRKQREEWRWAARERDVDLVVGHHAHVVRGVELHHGKVIFYGLGNFLIRGARNMGRPPKYRVCCDYGLMGKVHYLRGDDGRYRARAVQVLPVVDMHRKPKRWPVEEAKKRIEFLNALAPSLDDEEASSTGLRFQVRDSGTGLWCAEGAEEDPGRIGELCRTHEPPGEPSAGIVRRLRGAPSP